MTRSAVQNSTAFLESRRCWLCNIVVRSLVAIVLLGMMCPPATANEGDAARRPNVVIILADDLGFSDIGCYGSEIATPVLDRLANQGLRFTQFYNTARCWPSRAALLTGYYAQAVRRDTVPGVAAGGGGVRPTWGRLLPDLLAPAGYRSYHSGKWHIDGKVLAAGFQHGYTIDDHDRYHGPKKLTRDDVAIPADAREHSQYVTISIADHVIECLKEHAAQHAQAPFFQYVAFTAPHFPLHALEEDIARYRGKYQAGWEAVRQARFARMKELGLVQGELSVVEREVGPPYAFPDAIRKLGPNEVNRPVPWASLSPEQQAFQAEKMAIHAAMVDRMDREIGRIVAQLEAMQVLDNTLILFMSDNGASAEMMVRGDGHDPNLPAGSAGTYLSIGPGWSTVANTPHRRHKTWVHEGGIATPLIVHWPQGIAARGELRRTPSHLIDIAPTVLEISQSKPLAAWQGTPVPPAPGKSLVPAFAADVEIKRDAIWWQHEGNRALRSGDWKIVAAGPDAPWELYNLAVDRSESHNLAGEMPDKVKALAAQWEAIFESNRKLALGAEATSKR